MLPSVGALDRHWNRSCWVASVWRQATQNQIVYPPLDGNGWRQPDLNTLLVDWDSDDNIAKVRTAVAFIKKGCGCKTGCLTARCKCKKGGNHCGPGCKCLRCCNLPTNTSQDMVNIEVLVEETEECDSDSDDDVDNLETEVDDMMTMTVLLNNQALKLVTMRWMLMCDFPLFIQSMHVVVLINEPQFKQLYLTN